MRFEPGGWTLAVPRTDRVRVRSHSCSCGPVIYELCTAGGLRFIRRIRTVRGRRVIEESEWTNTRECDELWARMLGDA